MKYKFGLESVYSVLDQVVSLFFSLFLLILIGRFLGVDDLGVYQFSLSIVAIVSVFTNFGLSVIANREIAKSARKLPLYLGGALTIRNYLSHPLTMVITILVIALIGKLSEVGVVAILMAIYSAILSNIVLMNGALFSLHKVDKVFLVNGIYKLIAVAGVALLLRMGMGLSGLLIVLISIVLIVCIYLYKHIQAEHQALRLRCSMRFCKVYIAKSLPLMTISVAELISLRIDSVMLGVITTTSEVGRYAAAYNVYLAGVLIPLAVTKVFFPKFVSLISVEGNEDTAYNLMRKVTLLFLVYSVLVSVAIVIGSDTIINMVFGDSLSGAGKPLVILGIGLPFIVINRLYNYVLLALGENAWYLKISIVAAMANVLLNMLLIPMYSVVGAAIATVVTEGLMLVLAYIRVKGYVR